NGAPRSTRRCLRGWRTKPARRLAWVSSFRGHRLRARRRSMTCERSARNRHAHGERHLLRRSLFRLEIARLERRRMVPHGWRRALDRRHPEAMGRAHARSDRWQSAAESETGIRPVSDEGFRFTPGPQAEFPKLIMRAFTSPDQFVEWIFTP